MTDQKNNQKQRRLCDYCNQSKALLYCKADSARLCFSCDREVHSANQLFTRHSRSQLCDACDKSPASIFCETEQSVFCSNCDWENHKFFSSSLHNRRPIEGFTGCPSVSELVSFVGIDDLGKKAPFSSEEKIGCGDGEDDGLLNLLCWETPLISCFDDLIVSSDFDHGFKPTDVPPLPKNRNASCGQHKEEILHQLRELAKSESFLSFEKTDVEAVIGSQSLIPDTSCKKYTNPITFPAYESSPLQCFSDNLDMDNQVFLPFSQGYTEESDVVPDKHLDSSRTIHVNDGLDMDNQVFLPFSRGYTEESDVVPDKHLDSSRTIHVNDGLEDQLQHQIAAGTISALPKVAVHELNSQERDSAISRYKEKKKTRRYDKHVRYELRKVRAESRTRIKGRFAKVEH